MFSTCQGTGSRGFVKIKKLRPSQRKTFQCKSGHLSFFFLSILCLVAAAQACNNHLCLEFQRLTSLNICATTSLFAMKISRNFNFCNENCDEWLCANARWSSLVASPKCSRFIHTGWPCSRTCSTIWGHRTPSVLKEPLILLTEVMFMMRVKCVCMGVCIPC